MRLAEELGFAADARSDLFYSLLLKDAGCTANSAHMAALFGADDQVAKRTSKFVDWSRPLSAFVWSVRTVAPGQVAGHADRASVGDPQRRRGDAVADEGAMLPRCRDRAQTWILRSDRGGDSCAGRALGRSRSAARFESRGDPVGGKDSVPVADGGGLSLHARCQGGVFGGRAGAADSGLIPSSSRRWSRFVPTSASGRRLPRPTSPRLSRPIGC